MDKQPNDIDDLMDETNDSKCDVKTDRPNGNIQQNGSGLNPNVSSGYYDAEKCRAYIAKKTRVSKIDRFASQIIKATEVEAAIHTRLSKVLNLFVKRSAQVTKDFTNRCKLGLQRHRKDRILNRGQRKIEMKCVRKDNQPGSRRSGRQTTISNDLLYGYGAQLVHGLMRSQQDETNSITSKSNRQHVSANFDHCDRDDHHALILTEDDYVLIDSFDPQLYAKQLSESIESNLRSSVAINDRLESIVQLFERLASEHRHNVDLVYAAEEERQAATVMRRSAYNLSVVAIKATTTPVHVNTINEKP